MNMSLNESLALTARETFENLAFMFPTDEAVEESLMPPGMVSVDFDGPVKGTLVLMVARKAVEELAANMLGLDQEPATPVQQEDALKELANVICGNLLPAVAGAGPVFSVSAPKTLVQSPEKTGAAAVAEVAFETGMARMMLFVNGELKPE